MTRVIKAELLRLMRRRTLAVAVLASVAFSMVATLAVFASAREAGEPVERGGTTVAALAGAGGGTEAFSVGASFVGFLVFVTFIALLAGEFSGGTFRALLLRNPNRIQVIVGKLAGIFVVAAGAVSLAEAFSFVLSLLVAPGNDIPTGDWFSLDGLAAGMGNYARVLGGVAGWAVFGTTLAVVFRSTPIALAVGFAWAGPFENITVDSWSTGYRVFPGQLLASLIQGGTPEASLARSATTAAIYAAVAGVIALMLVSRRDVTA